jgi:RNase P/RNase MRP subunit POP5
MMPVRQNRRRYLLVDVFRGKITGSELNQILKEKMTQLYGAKGLSEANLKLIDFDSESNAAIIRCNHKSIRSLRATLALITSYNSRPLTINVIKSSGTIKSLKS